MIVQVQSSLDPRLAFQWRNADLPVLNVGCESDPAGFGLTPGAVNMDIDDWSGTVQNFVQHDACVAPWPFADKFFDTVVIGDALEHMEQPKVAVAEARRTARRAVVITLPADVPNDALDRWERHVEHLKTNYGLGACAPGDLSHRHGHHRHITQEVLRDWLSDLPNVQIGQVICSGDVKYWAIVSHLDWCSEQPVFPPRWPSVSIAVCTYRPGGLDLLSDSLLAQRYAGDWELLLVDELHPVRRRQEVVRDILTRRLNKRVRHLPNPRSTFPSCSTVTARNEAIVKADGEIVIFLTDYAVLRPDFIVGHILPRLGEEADLVINGAFYNVWPPRLHPDVRAPIDPNDPKLSGRSTIFDHWVTANEAWNFPLQNRTRTEHGPWIRGPESQEVASFSFPESRIDRHYCFLKNDSFPLELLRRIGGIDEIYAGLHRCDDTDVGLRLAVAGANFRHSKLPAAKIVQIRHLMKRLATPPGARTRGEALVAEALARAQSGHYFARATHPALMQGGAA